ncbi:sulfate ABC transporter substrate-binding protein [Aquihabitans sp. G128]|uniref:sulfate ABC transporter substrate-binding protein n=1 Tax=Aquihabitans sp. G128 TaxID=2849779 RepID=UPI001C227067|nr:sulfate ABC transporter substrate-binding protein [Aquihabitans sp. G128]QXC61672.1 sulfate ABC transporter substrate-binding protein [Aquihabitans sp. G128]
MKMRIRAALAVGVVGAMALAACGGGSASEGGSGDGSGSSTKLSIVGFAVPKSANDAAQAAFAKTPEGKGTSWKKSYGPSGDQARAVIAGLKADYVHLSLEGDVQKLADEGIVAKDWKDGPNKGIVSRSVVVIAVRKGNPEKIKGWDDIVKGDIEIVTPNPGSSGSARWNILAAYGHVLAQGGSEADAKAYLTKFFEHVVALPGGGRDATTAFTGGTGDVLISYENEAILARQSGEDFDYIVPDQTLLIENPGAVTVDSSPKAQAYLDFVLSKAGQTEFVKKGFRPLVDGIDVEVEGANDPSDPFPTPKDLLTIDGDFGGWKAAGDKFFDEEKGLVPAIQKATGKS